jgi:hypothetical protein
VRDIENNCNVCNVDARRSKGSENGWQEEEGEHVGT